MSAWLALLSFAAFAKYAPPPSNTLRFHGSCAHAFDAWAATQSRAYRETQRWFGAFLRDANPAVPPHERLSTAFLELHDEAIDRLSDLAPGDRAIYAHRLAKSGLTEGEILDEYSVVDFLNTLTGVHMHLRARDTLDLGAMPGAAVMLATVSGVLHSDRVFIGEYDPADPFAEEAVIEPASYQAFVTVEQTINDLRKTSRIQTLLDAFVPDYRYRRAALLQTIENLKRLRGMPPRVREEIRTVRDLRTDYDVDEDFQSQSFGRMVDVLREIETYGKLAARMNALNFAL